VRHPAGCELGDDGDAPARAARDGSPRDRRREPWGGIMTGETSADGYLEFLIARDGEPDFARHTLSRREAFFERLVRDPVRSRLPVHPRPPALFARVIIRLTIALPERWHLPLAGAAEMVGCLMFRALRDRGVALFAEEPTVAERIRLLYDEILGDEIGHVGQ